MTYLIAEIAYWLAMGTVAAIGLGAFVAYALTFIPEAPDGEFTEGWSA